MSLNWPTLETAIDSLGNLGQFHPCRSIRCAAAVVLVAVASFINLQRWAFISLHWFSGFAAVLYMHFVHPTAHKHKIENHASSVTGGRRGGGRGSTGRSNQWRGGSAVDGGSNGVKTNRSNWEIA